MIMSNDDEYNYEYLDGNDIVSERLPRSFDSLILISHFVTFVCELLKRFNVGFEDERSEEDDLACGTSKYIDRYKTNLQTEGKCWVIVS